MRRVVLGLAFRMGIAPREIEQWPMTDIRDLVAMLQLMNRPEEKAGSAAKPEKESPPTDESIMASLSYLRDFKGD